VPVKPDALKSLEAARKSAIAQAKEVAANTPTADVSDRDEAECFVTLVISMYASQLKVGFGVLPDGMAIFCRLSFPSTSTDSRAGMVSFLISDDTRAVLNKAVDALEADGKSRYWKADRFAAK